MPKNKTPQPAKKKLSKSEQRRVEVMKKAKDDPKPKKEEKKEETPEYFCARSEETGDKVYFVKGQTKRWVQNPFTLRQLGFDFADVRYLEFEELMGFTDDSPIDLTAPGELNPVTGKKSKGLPGVAKKTPATSGKVEMEVESPKPADPSKPHKVWS
jgi:hypothetical protein